MHFKIPHDCKGVVVCLATVKDESLMINLKNYLRSKEEVQAQAIQERDNDIDMDQPIC
jgi:hypothetical protein